MKIFINVLLFILVFLAMIIVCIASFIWTFDIAVFKLLNYGSICEIKKEWTEKNK